jgi:NAD(P)H dehydrogenase (quinone)
VFAGVRVLVVYAHPNPASFTHAVLEQVTRGLEDGGHDCKVNDLYAIGFDPVFRIEDTVQFAHESVPEELLDEMDPAGTVLQMAGGPLRRWMARRWLRGKGTYEIVKAIGEHKPKDVVAQQALVADADALIFVAPVFWMGLPAILKGWIERVFTYGFAYTLTPQGWKGDLGGRVPMLTQEKGLIVTPTFFTGEEYDKGWRQAMDAVQCDWSLKMAGVKRAEHVYFYAVTAIGEEARRDYLAQAYQLGKDF